MSRVIPELGTVTGEDAGCNSAMLRIVRKRCEGAVILSSRLVHRSRRASAGAFAKRRRFVPPLAPSRRPGELPSFRVAERRWATARA